MLFAVQRVFFALGDTRTPFLVQCVRLQHAAFNYFLKTSNPENGLVADTTRQGSPASIAVIGFGLTQPSPARASCRT